MSVITRGFKNAFRNITRTISIVIILGLSTGLALSMLVANQAVSQKIESVQSSVGNTVSVSPAGARGFEGGGEPLTTEQITKLKALTNVTSVDVGLSDRLTTENTNLVSAVDAGSLGRRNSQNSGQSFEAPLSGNPNGGSSSSDSSSGVVRTFTPPVTINGTTNPSQLSSTMGGGANSSTLSLTSGELFAADSAENVALVGKTLAEKNNLSLGSTFTAYDQTITVVGIFDSGNTFSNNQVIVPLKTLQTISNQADAITSATINVDSITNVESVTAAAKTALGTTADVTNDSERAQQSIEPLKNIQTISLYSLIGAVAASSVIILLTMVMIVRERRKEIGVIKAIGASNRKVISQFMVEAVTLTLFGSVIGIVFGVLAGSPITRLLVNNSSSSSAGAGGRMGPGGAGRLLSTIQSNVGFSIVFYGLGAAILIALIGSAITSYFISKVRPAEVMRTE